MAEGSAKPGSTGQGQLCDVQQGQVPAPALVSQQPCGMLQIRGRVAEKLPSRKGPRGADQQELNISPGGQEGHWHLYQPQGGHWTRAVAVPCAGTAGVPPILRAVLGS